MPRWFWIHALPVVFAGCFISGPEHDARLDVDGDGSIGAAHGGDDCDDKDAAVAPGAEETCDGVDQDCDGVVDGPGAVDAAVYFPDDDDDGFGDPDGVDASTTGCIRPAGTVANDGDCDDSDASVHPGALDDCDGKDSDCDGVSDEDGAFSWWPDADGDGFGDAAAEPELACDAADAVQNGDDCDDDQIGVHPGAEDSCGDAVDGDCDGHDELVPFWPDEDGDGHGGGVFVLACEAPPAHAADDLDCDDEDDDVSPDATETCNAADDDCDGEIDEGAGC